MDFHVKRQGVEVEDEVGGGCDLSLMNSLYASTLYRATLQTSRQRPRRRRSENADVKCRDNEAGSGFNCARRKVLRKRNGLESLCDLSHMNNLYRG